MCASLGPCIWVAGIRGGPRRVNHACVELHGKIYSFGGYNTPDSDSFTKDTVIDVHVLNPSSFRWFDITHKTVCFDPRTKTTIPDSPINRYGHTVVTFNTCAYMFGGRNDAHFAPPIVTKFNPFSYIWEHLYHTGMAPSARDGHSACVIDNCMYVFGGFSIDDLYENSLFCLDLTTLQWTYVSNQHSDPPSPRDFSCMLTYGNGFFLWGGRGDRVVEFHSGNSTYDNSFFYYDVEKCIWSVVPVSMALPNGDHGDAIESPSPPGRRSGFMVHFYSKILFGFGFDKMDSMVNNKVLFDGHHNDLWCLDPVTHEVSLVKPLPSITSGPCPRRRTAAVSVNNRVFIFGGTTPFNHYTFHSSMSETERRELYGKHMADFVQWFYDGEQQQSAGGPAILPLTSSSTQHQEEPDESSIGLLDLDDLYVLECSSSLKSLCTAAVIKYRLRIDCLPQVLKFDIMARVTDNCTEDVTHTTRSKTG